MQKLNQRKSHGSSGHSNRRRGNANAVPNRPIKQKTIAEFVERRPGLPQAWKRIHPDEASLASGRRTAACSFERIRFQHFAKRVVLHILQREQKGTSLLVTIADPRWRCPPEALKPADLSRLHRKLRHGIALLKEAGCEPVYIAVIEVSAARDVDGSCWFEPHIHMVIKGATAPEIRAAFQVRMPRCDRQRIRPVLVKEIEEGTLETVLGYISKMKPELRSGYERADGTRSRRPNRMPPDLIRLWFVFMASISIEELVVFGGFSSRLACKFSTFEMSTTKGRMS